MTSMDINGCFSPGTTLLTRKFLSLILLLSASNSWAARLQPGLAPAPVSILGPGLETLQKLQQTAEGIYERGKKDPRAGRYAKSLRLDINGGPLESPNARTTISIATKVKFTVDPFAYPNNRVRPMRHEGAVLRPPLPHEIRVDPSLFNSLVIRSSQKGRGSLTAIIKLFKVVGRPGTVGAYIAPGVIESVRPSRLLAQRLSRFLPTETSLEQYYARWLRGAVITASRR
ncbi:MAG: hypothetical protein HY401_10480 [Elusimicrobia bacterium]|nr:hypothetical protein [Elusimicrobiota bacterium]